MYQSQVVTGLYIDWVTYEIKVFFMHQDTASENKLE